MLGLRGGGGGGGGRGGGGAIVDLLLGERDGRVSFQLLPATAS